MGLTGCEGLSHIAHYRYIKGIGMSSTKTLHNHAHTCSVCSLFMKFEGSPKEVRNPLPKQHSKLDPKGPQLGPYVAHLGMLPGFPAP